MIYRKYRGVKGKDMIKIADSSYVDLLLRYVGRAKKVHLASPWIKPVILLSDDIQLNRLLLSKYRSFS
jgi:hypothetical protein